MAILTVLIVSILQRFAIADNSYGERDNSLVSRASIAIPDSDELLSSSTFSISRYKVQAFAPASPDIVTDNVVPLIPHKGESLGRRYMRAYQSQQTKRSTIPTSPVLELVDGFSYGTPIKFGNQEFIIVVDTGSSDTWMAGKGFSCVDVSSKKARRPEECEFGPSYDISASTTFKRIDNLYLNITYGDGEILNGVMGNEDVTLAGITVQTTVGIVDYAGWKGDGQSSGLMGLGYPSLTRAFSGSDRKKDNRKSLVPYNSVFTSMWQKNLTAPLFSLVLARSKSEKGALAFGGLPGPPFKFSNTFARTPIAIVGISQSPKAGNGSATSPPRQENRWYTIKIDNFAFAPHSAPASETQTMRTDKLALIDSGTSIIFLTPELTKAVNAQFTPPARYDIVEQTYYVNCNATPPRFGLTIGGVLLPIDPKELVTPFVDGTCVSAVQFGGPPDFMLIGDSWLKGVVSVFDVGSAEMRFAERL